MKSHLSIIFISFALALITSCSDGLFKSKQDQNALDGLNEQQHESLFAHLNWINGAPIVDGENTVTGEFVELEGWAIDPQAGSVASEVYVSIGNKIYTTEYGKVRDDVAKYFEDSKFKESGFLARIPNSTLSTGVFPIGVYVVGADGTSYYSSAAVKSFKIRL